MGYVSPLYSDGTGGSESVPAPPGALSFFQRTRQACLAAALKPSASSPAAARTPESVASALSTRFELGEQPGEIASHPCRYAGSTSATCLVGTFQRGSETWIRRGAVLEAGGQIVWLDVVGPASRVEDVDAFSNEVAELAAVRSAS